MSKLNVEVEQSLLQEAVNRVAKTASKDTKGDESSAIYVEVVGDKLKFYTQKSTHENSAVSSCVCVVKEVGSFAVPATKFSGVIGAFSGGKVNLEIKGEESNKLIVSQGKTKVTLQQLANVTKNNVSLPIEKIEKDSVSVQVNIKKLIDGLSKCNVFSKAPNDIYNSIFLIVGENTIKIFSSDKVRLLRSMIDGVINIEKKEIFAIVSGTFLGDISSWIKGINGEEMIDVVINKDCLTLSKGEDRFTVILVDAGGEDNIINYKSKTDLPLELLSKDNEIVVPTITLQKMASRINALAGTNEINKISTETVLSVKGDTLEIIYKGQNDSSSDILNIDNPTNIEFNVSYNNTWFMSLLANMSSDFVGISHSNKNNKILTIRQKDDLSYITCFALYKK